MIEYPQTQKPRAFFGRKKGDSLRKKQIALFDTLLPKVALDPGQPADLRALFPSATEIQMEIGFGGAEHLAAQALAHPGRGFIGSDGFELAVAKALVAIDKQGIGNIRLHYGDAADLLAWLPPASLSRVDLLYPDPWPKRRHWKRRFVQDESLQWLAKVLKPGGEFRFATDIPHYAMYALQRIVRSRDFEWTAERADDWRKPWDGFVSTRYEAKAIREGRTPAYFVFRRT